MGLAALRSHHPNEAGPTQPARLDPISLLPNRQQYNMDALFWGHSRATLVLMTLADAAAFHEILRVFGDSRSDAFIKSGAARLKDVLGVGTAVYHVNLLSFAFRVPGNAWPDPPALVRRLVEAFREPLLCDDVPIDTRIGIGLHGAGALGGSPAEDLRAALSAAQDSRTAGLGWSWYDRKTDEAHRRAFRLLSDLKVALGAQDELALHYQPKVVLGSGGCESAEALLRWNHPKLGMVSPGEFVTLAERTALVTPMTRWVIESAVTQVSNWARDGVDVSVAVNISPKNLEEPEFVDYLSFCCGARRLDPSRIELEITEGVNAARGGLILERLAMLRRLGFSIAIDDFGSGYSNMSYLTRLSAQTLKIDQSLVRGVEAGTPGGRLVSNIVQMGRDLGYRVVAEGIETETERNLLAGWGCDYGQGWHFGRPMPAAAFAEWQCHRAGQRGDRAAG